MGRLHDLATDYHDGFLTFDELTEAVVLFEWRIPATADNALEAELDGAPSDAASIADTPQELPRLRDRGLLTVDELLALVAAVTR